VWKKVGAFRAGLRQCRHAAQGGRLLPRPDQPHGAGRGRRPQTPAADSVKLRDRLRQHAPDLHLLPAVPVRSSCSERLLSCRCALRARREPPPSTGPTGQLERPLRAVVRVNGHPATVADAQGRFRLSVPAGRVIVRVQFPRFPVPRRHGDRGRRGFARARLSARSGGRTAAACHRHRRQAFAALEPGGD